ncbi:MAG: transglycosylase domain-containing protein [Flavobacteriales bacterium]|nr:transglycosylase domain-containing protein [Flavobacteriales bacterium]
MENKKTNKNINKSFSLFRKLLWGCLIGSIVLSCGIFTLIYMGVFGPLPTFDAIENPESSIATEIISENGETIGRIWQNENRSPIKYDELSPYLVNALIATEDERFREHSGVDIRSTMRAVVFLGSKGGASTITQQLAKQLFTSNPSQNKVERVIQKFKEWIIAAKLERNYTKDEILTMYFNKYDFLYNAYGIKNASLTYFNKQPKDLNVEEAAVLVGMAKNPIVYNPIRNPKNSLARRNQVLSQMVRNDFLTEKEADSLKRLPLVTDFRMQTHTRGLAQYFREYIREIVPKYLKGKEKADGEPYSIETDGLKIYTTLDSRMQQYAEEAVEAHISSLQKIFDYTQKSNKNRPFYSLSSGEIEKIMNTSMRRSDRYRALKNRGLSEKEIVNNFNTIDTIEVFCWEKGKASTKDIAMTPMDSIRYYKGLLNTGFMSVEPRTGHIKAWVGGINYKYFQYDHVIKARRQVGSTFKPFVYATAIDQLKMSPCYQYMDEPVHFSASEWGMPYDWSPSNSDNKYEHVPYTLIRGLAMSKNSITASIVKTLGTTEPIIALAHKLGITGKISSSPAMCLGTTDISVYEMAGAFATFANKGSHIKPILITRIEDKNGIVIYQDATPSSAVMSEESAYAIIKLLEGVTSGGTGSRLRSTWGSYIGPDPEKTNFATGYPWKFTNPIAGKTGTSQNQSDGWFIGVVPNLATAVWVGCEDRAAHFASMRYGQGASAAMPIWAVFMKKCYADPSLHVSKNDFEMPSGPMTIDLSCQGVKKQEADNTTTATSTIKHDTEEEIEF